MRGRGTCRRGFSLVEILAVIWALGLVLLLGVVTLRGALQVEKTAAAADHANALRGMVADQFRADVAMAAAAPEGVGPLKAGPSCLLLRLADGTYVAYRVEAGRLERAALATVDAAPYWMPLGGEGVDATFTAAGPGRRLLTLTLREPVGSGPRKRTSEITADLGGDLR